MALVPTSFPNLSQNELIAGVWSDAVGQIMFAETLLTIGGWM